MSVPKIMGTETEYGLFVPGLSSEDSTKFPSHSISETAREIVVVASDELGAAFKRDIPLEVLRDVERRAREESQRRIREFRQRRRMRAYYDDEYDYDRYYDWDDDVSILPNLQVRGRTGHVLGNGARFYVDMGHPEYSTPETRSARDLLIWEKAGERIVELGREKVAETQSSEIFVHKNNSDGKGRSYSCHENYLLDPETFVEIVSGGARSRILETFFVSRQIITGSGKVGAEAFRAGEKIPYQISQRADFIARRLSTETSWDRPIINQRDRPYADRKRFRRLHVICGDSNMAELSIFLRMGITAIVLMMLEDGFFADESTFLTEPLRDPVRAFRTVSSDLELKQPLLFEDGKKRCALEIQHEFLRMAERYFERRRKAPHVEREVLRWWGFVLEKLSLSPDTLSRHLDWCIKREFLSRQRERWNAAWDDPRLRWIDIQYHSVNPRESWYHFLLMRGKIERLVSDAEIERAIRTPPSNTRAYIRGMLIQKFLVELRDIGWDYVSAIDFTKDISNPLMGTRSGCHKAFKESRTLKEFFDKLEGGRPAS